MKRDIPRRPTSCVYPQHNPRTRVGCIHSPQHNPRTRVECTRRGRSLWNVPFDVYRSLLSDVRLFCSEKQVARSIHMTTHEQRLSVNVDVGLFL